MFNLCVFHNLECNILLRYRQVNLASYQCDLPHCFYPFDPELLQLHFDPLCLSDARLTIISLSGGYGSCDLELIIKDYFLEKTDFFDVLHIIGLRELDACS
jgi:hypothetical protein